MVSPFCRNPCWDFLYTWLPYADAGGCKPKIGFERSDAATPVSFAHVDCFDKEIIAYCYINDNYFDEITIQ